MFFYSRLALSQVDHDVDKPRRMPIDYDQRANTAVNGMSPAYPPPSIEQNDQKSEDYRDAGSRPVDRYPISPNRTMIKQEVLAENSAGSCRPGSGGSGPPGEPKVVMDHEIRALNGIISAKEYEVNHFKDYNVHLQKVGSEREYEIDKLKRKLRDVENERDGMEKKWLDQVQNHVKEKYLIADLQKEVLLWKGKFKNLLDRIQTLECDARRDFDYSCRRTTMGEAPPTDFVHGTNVITPKASDAQRTIPRGSHEVEDKSRDTSGMTRIEGALHVPPSGTGAVSVISRDRAAYMPRVGMYRPEPTYIYGFPSQAAAIQSSMVQNGLPAMKMITSGVTYYDVRREAAGMENGVASSADRPRDQLAVVTDETSVQLNGCTDEEKELTVDVVDSNKDDGVIAEDVEEDEANKRLVIGNKAKIIVRKRSDPTRFLPNHKRKRVR